MEILQLAQPDVVRTVYLLVWTGTRQLFFCFLLLNTVKIWSGPSVMRFADTLSLGK